MGFALVGAAGSLAGSYAAEAIQGKPKEWGVDTSIPGVSSATIKEGGKGGKGKETVPQVDISQSLKWFQQAAEEQTSYYEKGLNYYNAALKQAAVEINSGYTKANNTLKPLSYASNQAMNEQMRMMGLDPISNSSNFTSRAAAMGVSSDLQKKLASAEKLKDPTQRQEAKQQILSQINTEQQAKLSALNQEKTQVEANNSANKLVGGTAFSGNSLEQGGQITDQQFNSMAQLGMTPESKGSFKGLVNLTGAGAKTFNDYLAARDQKIKAEASTNASKLADVTARLQETTGSFSQFASDYDTAYSDTYDKGYTGQEVTDRITSTPGYQFQMDQGTKAIERQGAAKGMLGSGNTLMALTQYGQQLGQNFYGMYMDNLARITEQGSGATQQIAANQVNQGKDYGALLEAGGQAGMQTQQLIGNARAEQLYKSGQLYSDAAQFNAGLQYQGVQAGKGRDAQMAQAALGAQAGIMNANTKQQAFNYGVFQNQQAGASYANSRGYQV